MDYNHRRFLSGMVLGLPLAFGSAFAAKPMDLSHQRVSALQSIISSPAVATKNAIKFAEISRSLDLNSTLHVRVQEMYAGYPVLGADAIVHIPHGKNVAKPMASVLAAANTANGTMDGVVYPDLKADLDGAPAHVFAKEQAAKALQEGIAAYQHKVGGAVSVRDQQSKLVVYVDNSNKAHWAYQVNFYVEPAKDGAMPAKPVYIMDANSFNVYEQWNNIQTVDPTSDNAEGGGNGGNLKMGELTYDGLAEHLPSLKIQRDASNATCYMRNDDVVVKNYRGKKVMNFDCQDLNADHNNVYWDGETDEVNGGYSPTNDALFGGAVIKDMYQKWYGIPVLTESSGKPMKLTMIVHDPIDNAYWDGSAMTFGDGVSYFYPLTSLGVAAHEISHGFTEQHSGLNYRGQSGGMNEAFSDMAAQAAEFYAYGKNSWQIGPEIFKAEDEALRYMDKPSKDCKGDEPGDNCSIDDASQYHSGLDVHYSSGVYNRAFYLMGTAPGWDAKKAFDVMVHANMNYWTSSTNFARGACGVIKATRDLGFEEDVVRQAFDTVKVDTSSC